MTLRRLLDDPNLPPTVRQRLQAGTEVSPVKYDAAAGAARLQQAMDGSLLPGGSDAVPSVPGLATSSLVAAKVWGVAVVLLALGGGLVWLALDGAAPAAVASHSPSSPPAPAPAPREKHPSRAGDADGRADKARPVPHEPSSPAEPTGPGSTVRPQRSTPVHAPRPAARKKQRGEARTAPEPPAAAAKAADPLAEARALARARRLLDTDPVQALSVLRTLARTHSQGLLVEERLALQVLAFAAAGQDAQAKAHAARYLARYPQGAWAARVRLALKTPTNSP